MKAHYEPHPPSAGDDLAKVLLPGVPAEEVLACYRRAKGNEIGNGKFASPESSSALVANTFGFGGAVCILGSMLSSRPTST